MTDYKEENNTLRCALAAIKHQAEVALAPKGLPETPTTQPSTAEVEEAIDAIQKQLDHYEKTASSGFSAYQKDARKLITAFRQLQSTNKELAFKAGLIQNERNELSTLRDSLVKKNKELQRDKERLNDVFDDANPFRILKLDGDGNQNGGPYWNREELDAAIITQVNKEKEG